jgi:hypothetical protein
MLGESKDNAYLPIDLCAIVRNCAVHQSGHWRRFMKIDRSWSVRLAAVMVLGALLGVFLSLGRSPIAVRASAPGIPFIQDPNLTSFAPSLNGGFWVQKQLSRNECPPDCSAGNTYPPGTTLALDGAPTYENVDQSGSIVWTPGTNGYWVVSPRGEIHSRGGAPRLCENRLEACSGFHPGKASQIVAVAADPKGRGIWAVGIDGKVWTASEDSANNLPSYGDAQDSGSYPTGIAAAPDGKGYCISIADGGVYCRGEENLFHGANPPTNEFITGIAFYVGSDQRVLGYWLIAKDGGVFAFDAPFWGSAGGNGNVVTNIIALPQPGQNGDDSQTAGYAWIDKNGAITVVHP